MPFFADVMSEGKLYVRNLSIYERKPEKLRISIKGQCCKNWSQHYSL